MKSVRTRFAPSPTGIMHIGNVRAALLNYLFARQNNGTFVLRIEDTDQQRNIEQGTQYIIKHLKWLGLTYSEGPDIGGKFGPYFQSQRSDIYQKYLDRLHEKNFIYRCFCTPQELETRRNRQIAMKKAPRYEGTCLKLTASEIQQKLDDKISFIWRMKVDSSKKISFQDLARGTLEFDLQHFSDFPLTREDGSFTFIFANCIDDCEMEMTHVFRGEEHLSNTVSQVVLYQALDYPLPTFWHLPILCNQEGKKLSKRDKGFSLDDVENQGFLPETICNYLGILGVSFQQEIMSLDELAKNYRFDHLHGASQIKYDIEKLKWMNHKWIAGYDLNKLVQLCKPFLTKQYDLSKVSDETLTLLIKSIQTDLATLADSAALLKFYFEKPNVTHETVRDIIDPQKFDQLLTILKNEPPTTTWDQFLSSIKPKTKDAGISDKEMFSTIRTLLTGSPKGMQMNDLFICLGAKEFFARIQQ
ncbi:MAG TPA: glutamate--tRNA ligase [Candidatus Saccharimonadales bacterium]|nr:glutamate--tRNA ligase [Candidatus Saccharimonadales bacterium]